MPLPNNNAGLNVLSIVPYNIFPAKVGGQKGIALFNEYFSKEVNLYCFTVSSNDPAYAKSYTIINGLSSSVTRYINPFYFFTIRKLIRQYKISHVLLEHPYYGWLGMLLKLFCGVQLIIHSHNIESTRWQSLGKWWWKIMWWYERATHRVANYNFFIQDDDRNYAIKNYKLSPGKCTTITYGIEWSATPDAAEKKRCREELLTKHNIQQDETIFLFNGALDYKPNYDAVITILEKINPILVGKPDFKYRIIICGRGLPAALNELKDYHDQHILYAGFVDDITVYFKGADIFINPISDGGGIKTKLVEAIGYSTPAVSTQSGSIGVGEEAGGVLHNVADRDWQAFAAEMQKVASQQSGETPSSFYQKFYWGNIAKKAANFIQS